MRQAKDPHYAELLHRLRVHQPTDQDIDLLNTRIHASLSNNHITPIIIRRHQLRTPIFLLQFANGRSGPLRIRYQPQRECRRTEESYIVPSS